MPITLTLLVVMFSQYLLILLALPLRSYAAQSVLKATTETFENVLSFPEDPSDPAAWDFDWSFTGIRYFAWRVLLM